MNLMESQENHVARDDIPSDMAGRFTQALEHRGITRAELAELAGVRKNTVGDILSGSVTAPGVDTVMRLCTALRVYPNYIILGILPRFFEDSVELQPVRTPKPNVTLGVDQWLEEEPGKLTTEERAYMRALPWEDPQVRQPDSVYLLALAAFRQSRGRSTEKPRK